MEGMFGPTVRYNADEMESPQKAERTKIGSLKIGLRRKMLR